MRWRVVGAVVFAFACSYAILWGFNCARARLGEAVEDLAEQIEVAGQPRFEVARRTRTLEPTEDKRLRIENIAGRVEVVPGGPETIVEYVIYARGEDEAAARLRAEPVEVRSAREAESGDRIWVALEKGERWPSHVSVELVVKTPPERALSIRAISADISVTDIHGGIEAEATSGDVRVTGSGGGRVAVSSTSGDLRVEDADGSVEARATSGDISLSGLRGPATTAKGTSGDIWLAGIQSQEVSVNSSSGDVSLEEMAADRISARSSSGDVRITAVAGEHIGVSSSSGDIAIEVARPFSGEIESRTSSGDATVSLPASSDCEVEAKTASGTIHGERWQEISRGHARTRLGAGAGSVEISTTSGNIHLNTKD
jgi:DUF4097 and DUF4098 domain-containing protein YvlB